MANDQIFSQNFFKELAELIFNLFLFFRRYWFWGIIFLLILLILIILQQMALFHLSGI